MFPVSQQVRGLVDCDSFYASCEVYLNPKLRGLPVCIGGDIVIARSYEAKPYGIKVGTPIREAKKMLPDNAVYMKPNMTKYGQISAALMSYLHEKCLGVEVFSIDEAFFEITKYDQIYHMSYPRIANALKRDIKKKIGIPVSIGLAPTRLLCKIFADIHKPYGEHVALSPEQIDLTLQGLPLADIPFIGPQTQKKLTHKCTTAYDFKALRYEYVRDLLGKNGVKIWLELNCINAMNFANKKKPRSINRTRSFNPDFVIEKSAVWSRLSDNIDKACEHLLDVQMATKYVALHFRTKEFKRFGVELKLPQATNNKMQITKIAKKLFDSIKFGEIVFRTTGIYLGDLIDATHIQSSLFDAPQQTIQHSKLNDILYKINKKYGRGTIRLGELGGVQKKNDLFEMSV